MIIFVLYISDTVGRNFASQEHTVIQKVFIRNVSFRFYAQGKFCICFEVHTPVYRYSKKPTSGFQPLYKDLRGKEVNFCDVYHTRAGPWVRRH